MSTTSIEWTDVTWNPLRGCVKVSPGCAHCFASTFAKRWRGVKGHPYEQGFDLRLVPEKLIEPLRWKTPRRVFVNSMSDLFQDGVPDEYIATVFGVMAACPQHTFQVLTKRADRLPKFSAWLDAQDNGPRTEVVWQALREEAARVGDGGPMHTKYCASPDGPWPLPNVWLGVSVENQHFADERIPLLLQTPAAVRFISYEPALGPVDLVDYGQGCSWLTCKQGCNGQSESTCLSHEYSGKCFRGIDWVIVGGESGPGARPFDVAWARSVVQQCAAAGVACFVKQLGAAPLDWNRAEPTGRFRTDPQTGNRQIQVTQPRWLKDRKGADMAEWPEDLRVRQFPEARV